VAPGYAAGALDSYTPHGETSGALRDALRQSRQMGRSVLAFERDGESCRVIAVIGGDDVLGAVLLFRRSELDEIAVRTFERSATIMGIVLLSRERMEANRSRDSSTLLRALVSPRQDDLPLLCERALALGLDLAQPASVIVVEMPPANAVYAARRLRAGNALAASVFDEVDGMLVVIAAATRAEGCRRELADLAGRELGVDYLGVLSRPLPAATQIPATYTALRRALPVLRRMGIHSQVVQQNEMALYAALFETHDQDSLASFLAATIGPLTSHDPKRGAELAQTLLGYFDCNQNAKVTAQRLGIHVNTLRQRLASIEDILGHWGSATRALEIHMALRLWNLGGAPLQQKVAERAG
jgi:sugar diacid utilization regulator